ncbi:MAG: ABC transporter ATP-binding protein, partial [Bdellovibrionota bacterium]
AGFLSQAELFILDEPMSGLDPLGRRDIRELILGLAGEGKTIFFSSHVIPDVEAICTEVGIIRHGKIVGNGPIGGFLSKGPLRTEIGVQGVPVESLKGIADLVGMQAMPDGFRLVVTGQESVTRTLERLLALRATILWVTPIRPSLDEIFAQEEKS